MAVLIVHEWTGIGPYVKEMAPVTHTTFWRGIYDTDPVLRAEFLSACGGKK